MFGLAPFGNDFLPSRSRSLSDFHNFVDGFFNNDRFLPSSFNNENFKMDIREDEENYMIDAELPGISKDEIRIDYENNHLSIDVQREESNEESKEKYLHRERRFSSMRRTVYLPGIKSENISASFKDGVLEIVAKKDAEEEVSSRIEIQ